MSMNPGSKIACCCLALAIAFVFVLVSAAPALAVPKDVEPGSKLVYKFNIIGYPAGKLYTGNCGQGHRIFVNREANHTHIRITDANDGWYVSDCDATGTSWAEIHSDRMDIYDVYVRILGKPGGHINICADPFTDYTTHEHLCLLGTIDLTRGKGQSKLSIKPSQIFDASMMDIMWKVETNSDFRIAEFRIYARP
ncbi:MAG: hypothetical protein JSW03_00900 [Candidatus Eiseniibacteriota bacterium]|nr:MAG: hypothetical protein JSW03_00900 [Candidatus Eisenbacteria bacterium]